MKQLSTLIFGLFFAINTNAQNAEAQLLFEEAETLYEKYTTMDCAKNTRMAPAHLSPATSPPVLFKNTVTNFAWPPLAIYWIKPPVTALADMAVCCARP